MRVAPRPALVLLACACLAAAGCGGSRRLTGVHGRLLDHGGPVKVAGPLPPGDPGVRLAFHPTDPPAQGKEPQLAAVTRAEDGTVTFDLPGNDRKGVAPGRYRVSIAVGANGLPDQLQGAFGEHNSPVVREVTGSNQEIVIDLAGD